MNPPPPLQVERINHIIIFNIIKKILEFNILLLKYTPKLTIYHNLPHTMSFCAMRLLHVSKNNLTPPPLPKVNTIDTPLQLINYLP